ncbi:hypothetical protein HK098_005316 [Nowakowskiella sp. JEL0407]|nr:hypothetical protein HK098_005316 [Nowakowskiella sp. JEL0407]
MRLLFLSITLLFCSELIVAFHHANVKLNGNTFSGFVGAYKAHKKPVFGKRPQPYPSQIDVSLSSAIASHSFKLTVNPDIWAPGNVTVTYTDGKTESIFPPAVQYRAEFSNTTVSATIFQNGISMLIHNATSGESLEVRPKVHLGKTLSAAEKAQFEAADTLIFTPNMPPSSCGSEPRVFPGFGRRSSHETQVHSDDVRLHKRLGTAVDFNTHGTAPMFTNCYAKQSIQHVAQIGFHVDYGAYSYLDKNLSTPYLTLAFIGSLIADSNVVYTNQLNILLKAHPTATKIMTYPKGTANQPDYSWNWSPDTQCFGTLDNGLNIFNSYVNALPAQNDVASYALLSKCPDSNGYAGLAFVGTACGSSRTSLSIIQGTTGASTWLVFAHETGHNFNATHSFQEGKETTGGIMDYGDGRYPAGTGWYGFHPKYNQAEVCSKLQNVMNSKPNCLLPVNQVRSVCGNGIVEEDEDCDPGPGQTSPCCTSSCKFTSGAVCDYKAAGSVGKCCTTSCTYQPPSFSCGFQQYCSNGACTESICSTYSNIDFCSLGACTYGCKFSGSACRTPSYFQMSGGAVADGTYCDVGKACSNGNCVATSPGVTTTVAAASLTTRKTTTTQSTPTVSTQRTTTTTQTTTTISTSNLIVTTTLTGTSKTTGVPDIIKTANSNTKTSSSTTTKQPGVTLKSTTSVTTTQFPACTTTPLLVHSFDRSTINNLGGNTGTGGSGQYSVSNGLGIWQPTTGGYVYTNLFPQSNPAPTQCISLTQYRVMQITIRRTDSNTNSTISLGMNLGCEKIVYKQLPSIRVSGVNKLFKVPLTGVDLSAVRTIFLIWSGSSRPSFAIDTIDFRCK